MNDECAHTRGRRREGGGYIQFGGGVYKDDTILNFLHTAVH